MIKVKDYVTSRQKGRLIVKMQLILQLQVGNSLRETVGFVTMLCVTETGGKQRRERIDGERFNEIQTRIVARGC